MIISVASGKGGTGKTTVATNLAWSVKDPVQLLDCDVEAPNAHLFLTPELQTATPVRTAVPQIDLENCTFCRKCMEICRYGALAVLKKDVLVFDNLCHSCGGCFEVCSEKAVREKWKILGEIQSGRAGHVDFAQGRLEVGQVMVPPVIKAVREHTDPEQVTVIDAPPGTSCPVIAAVNRSDFILLVTEPTPFGLHDLTLAVETVKILDIPYGLVINRAGIGNNDVNIYAEQEQIPILMEIPFDREIAKAYSRGQMIVHAVPGYDKKFYALFTEITRLVKERQVAS